MLSMERGLPEVLHDFINEMKQAYTMEIVFGRCKPVFIHQYALSRLKADGYLLAVCSNSIRQSIEMMLSKADLLRYLDFYMSNEEVKIPKPNPEMYINAISRLGLTPDQCLVVEDNPNGIKAARESGAHLLCVTDVVEVSYANIVRRIRELEAQFA
jgi:beta-phosphoglucomutase-like phosphatase (HAD superfamily)